MAQTKYEATQARLVNADENVMSDAQNKVADADIKALKAAKEQAVLYKDLCPPRWHSCK